MTKLFLWCAAAVFGSILAGSNALALTVTATTSDNGYPAHLVQWIDADGLPRSAMMVDANSTGAGPYAGYLRQYTYQFNGAPRVCTGTTDFAKGENLETSGDGFIQNHTADGGDFSTGNGAGMPGSTAVTLQGASHAIITYSMPTYTIAATVVPSTISWFFADGRDHPVYAITQDARGSAGNLGADTRSPYGDMAYDGDGTDALVGGFSWGDQFKFVTLATAPEEVTQKSPWKDTDPNIVPYAMQWAEPSTVDAEMGHVSTAPLSLVDAGADTRTDAADNDLFDTRTMTAPNGPLPPEAAYTFQIIEDSFDGNNPTDSKRLTWGATFGRVGGFDNFGDTSLDPTQYSRHSDDPVNKPLSGTRADGLLCAYSVFVVFGPHSMSYLNGATAGVVSQVENVTKATLNAIVGSVDTTGPAGVGSAANATITYSPAGYDPTFASWDLEADGNAVSASLVPALVTPISHPVFQINNYTSPLLPTSISVNGGSVAGTDYFATVDHANHKLWITVNDFTSDSPIDLIVTAPPPSTPPTVTVMTKGNPDVTEGAGNGKFLLTRAGDDESSDLTVLYKLKGSAVNGTDYQMIDSSAVIPAGSASAKIKIKPIDDDLENGTRTVKLKLVASPTGDYTLGDSTKATISILDND